MSGTGQLGRSAQPAPANDPVFDPRVVFRGNTPRDLAENHDHYLYGDAK